LNSGLLPLVVQYTTMIILFLYGFSKAGKDTCAEILVKEHGFRRFAFADKVKEIAASNLGVPLEWFHDVNKKNSIVDGKTLRQHCIEIGEGGRNLDAEMWGKKVVEDIKQSTCSKIVISDWRCYPEFFAVQKAFPDAKIIPIQILRKDQFISPVPDMTEYNLAGFPFQVTLVNNGTSIDMLRAQINNLGLF
jgi:hypothetical protein